MGLGFALSLVGSLLLLIRDYVCLATFGFLSLLEGRKSLESPFSLWTH